MKKFKLSVWVMALVSMLGFTSCLDGGEPSNIAGGSNGEFVKLNNYLGLHTFTTQFGAKLNPLNASQVTTWPTTPFAFISYTYEKQEMTGSEVDITLAGLGPVFEGRVLPTTPTETDANAGIYSLTSPSSPQFVYGFYQLNDMFLCVNFYLRDVDNDETLDEIAAHQFTLHYNPAEDFDGSSMTLYLRHKVTDIADDDKFSELTACWQHFDLSAALSSYKATYNKEPNRIIISYEQSTDGSYEENKVSDRTAELNYPNAVSYYKEWLESQNDDSSNSNE